MIIVENLNKKFGELEVLRDISETIYDGEKIVIIGPSGSGKSTFLRCLNLLETPTSGTITIDGVDITDPKTDINKVRSQMGMVFQNFNLFPHLTVLQNITLAPIQLKLMNESEARDKARYLLERVGLMDKIDEYPGRLSGTKTENRHCQSAGDESKNDALR